MYKKFQAFMMALIQKRNDWKLHEIGGNRTAVLYPVILFIALLANLQAVTVMIIITAYFVLYAIATALYEIYQKVTKKGEYNWIDWCFGMVSHATCYLCVILTLIPFLKK